MAETRNDDALEALFAAARTASPDASGDFLARLQSDADASVPSTPSVTVRSRPSVFGGLKGLFAASGLSGAAIFGLWIGFVMPDAFGLLSLTATDETVGLYTFMPGADLTAPDLSE